MEELSRIRVWGGGRWKRWKRNLYFNRSIEKLLSVQRQTRIYFAIPPHLAASLPEERRGWRGERKEERTKSRSDSYVDETWWPTEREKNTHTR